VRYRVYADWPVRPFRGPSLSPYQTWERVAYLAINRLYRQTGLARRVHERIVEAREQQDNEEWHLLIMAELAAREGAGRGWIRYRLFRSYSPRSTTCSPGCCS